MYIELHLEVCVMPWKSKLKPAFAIHNCKASIFSDVGRSLGAVNLFKQFFRSLGAMLVMVVGC